MIYKIPSSLRSLTALIAAYAGYKSITWDQSSGPESVQKKTRMAFGSAYASSFPKTQGLENRLRDLVREGGKENLRKIEKILQENSNCSISWKALQELTNLSNMLFAKQYDRHGIFDRPTLTDEDEAELTNFQASISHSLDKERKRCAAARLEELVSREKESDVSEIRQLIPTRALPSYSYYDSCDFPVEFLKKLNTKNHSLTKNEADIKSLIAQEIVRCNELKKFWNTHK